MDIEASSAARRLVASLAVLRIKAAVAAKPTELKRTWNADSTSLPGDGSA
jgi:hypothetical protein